MSSDIGQRLSVVLESVLGPIGRGLSDQDGPGSVPVWDSVTHLNLILAVEQEFDVRFETAEIPDLISVGKLRARLEAR